MQINEITIEQAQAAETRAYVKHHVALQDAVQAYRSGLDLAPWAANVEETRKSWNDAMDALDLALTEKDGKTRRALSVPSVLHAKWKLADGRTGTIFACVHDKPVEFTFGKEKLRLEPGEAAFRKCE